MKIKPWGSSGPLTLTALAVIASFLLLSFDPSVSLLVLAGGLLAALVWWGSRYQRMTLTVYRKWQTSERVGKSKRGALYRWHSWVRANDRYHFATCNGEAQVTKAIYNRVKEGSVIKVVAKTVGGNLYVLWPLF